MASASHFMDHLFLPITFILLTLSLGFVQGQSPYEPFSTGGSASVFIEDKAFYIQGGSIQNTTTSQTFSIDLHSSWSTSAPAYTPFPDGLYDRMFPNTLLPDGTTWFALSNNTFVTYNIPDGKVTRLGPATMFSNYSGLSAVFDRGLGEIVVPNGFNDGVQTINLYIAPGNLSTRENPPFPISEISVLLRYSLAWSDSTQTAFLFGGSTHSVLSGVLFQRHPSPFGNWGPVNTTLGGVPLSGPSPREAACMVPAFNGTKLILFGGSGITATTSLNVALSDTYIYDVANASWTKGAVAGATRARAAHACAISGDALIVWGGFSDLVVKKPALQMTAVYNLTSSEWVDRFIASPIKQDPSPVSKPNPTGSAGNGSNSGLPPTTSRSGNSSTGAIIGGLAAAVVVLAALGLVLWRRGLLKKCGIHLNVRHQQSGHRQSDGGHSNKEPVEKIRDPHIDPYVQPLPQPVARSTIGTRYPQLVMSQYERDFTAQMQLESGARHPQWDMPQQEHEDYKQGNEGLYHNRGPVGQHRDPQGGLNAQSILQSVSWPAHDIRNPQLDISRRKREVAAEMQMLEYDSGEARTCVQHTGEWSIDRSGGSFHPR